MLCLCSIKEAISMVRHSLSLFLVLTFLPFTLSIYSINRSMYEQHNGWSGWVMNDNTQYKGKYKYDVFIAFIYRVDALVYILLWYGCVELSICICHVYLVWPSLKLTCGQSQHVPTVAKKNRLQNSIVNRIKVYTVHKSVLLLLLCWYTWKATIEERNWRQLKLF